MGWTERGKYHLLDRVRGASLASPLDQFNFALVTDAVAPTYDTVTFGELTEVAAGNGYTSGGIAVNRNSTDFDVLGINTGDDYAYIQLKDMVWTASSGPLPSSGGGMRYAVLTDNNAVVADREILYFWDLGSSYTIGDTQSFTVADAEIRIGEVP